MAMSSVWRGGGAIIEGWRSGTGKPSPPTVELAVPRLTTPSIIEMEGEETKDGKIAMTYEQLNPELGKVTKRRNVMTHEGDSMSIDFFETVDGEETKMMSITMKRKK